MIRTLFIRSSLARRDDASFRTTLLALLVLMITMAAHRPAAGGPTIRPATGTAPGDVPAFEDAIPAWLVARGWLTTGEVPGSESPESRVTIEGLSAVGVLLRLDGRVVGRGFDPDGDAFAVRRAFGRAMAQALGDRTIRSLPEPWRSTPGPRLQFELELAGPRHPLVGGTLATAARRLRPGLDGVAVVRGDNIAVAMPGRLLSTGTADGAGGTLIRLLDEVGLPPQDLPELRRIDDVRLERFETLRLGQATPDAMPEIRSRLGRRVDRRERADDDLADTADALRDRLLRWRPAADPANPDADRLWLGDFDPIAGTHTPLEATPTDRLLAIRALRTAGVDDLTVPRPEDFDDAAITPAVVDLALLAAGDQDADAARAWLALSTGADQAVPESDRNPAAALARRAAALGELAPEVLPTETFDDAYEDAWAACGSLPDVLAAFDWLCLAERSWWRRHQEPGPRIESLRAVRDSLLARQIDDPSGDLDGSIPLRAGPEEVSDARCLRLLLGMAALAAVPDDDAEGQARANRGLSGLIRFMRQLQVTPEEAADLPGGRRAVGGVQAGPADPRQPLVATAVALIACDLLRTAAP